MWVMVVCMAFQYNRVMASEPHAVLIIKLEAKMVAYCILDKSRPCGKYLVHQLCTPERQYHFGVLPVSAAEEDRILYTCDTCAYVKLGQSRWDRLWQGTSFDDTCEQTLFDAKSVRATELIVLILRACLDPMNPAFPVVAACPSRTVTPEELWHSLEGCLQATSDRTIQGWIREWDQNYCAVENDGSKTLKICEKPV